MLDFEYSRDERLKSLGRAVNENPEDLDSWKELLEACLKQDGRLNRGSDPAEIAATRATFNQYLTLYPLSQDTWMQYADLEFRIVGTEAAQYIYERAVGGCGSSVDIWAKYCDHMGTTSHNPRVIRELHERAIDTAGFDFHADRLWDGYIQFMRQHADMVTLFEIYQRVIKIPLYHYLRYFNEYRGIASQMPITSLEPEEIVSACTAEVQRELVSTKPAEFETAVRNKLEQKQFSRYEKLRDEVNSRWHWEQHIGKDSTSTLDEAARVKLWTEYLDFEEQKGNYAATKALYERCMMYSSTHLPFWYRYVRWLTAQPGKEEEVRNVYRQASYLFAPIYDPSIRLSWAKFEEAHGRSAVAADIYESILDVLPNDLQTNTALTMLYRRQQGIEGATKSLADRLASSAQSPSTLHGALVAEWARLIWRETGDVNAARQIFTHYQSILTDVASFWAGWMAFEIEQPVRTEKGEDPDRARTIYQTMQQMANGLPAKDLQELSSLYMQYLDERGDAAGIAELVELDAVMHGPASLRMTGSASDTAAVNGQSG